MAQTREILMKQRTRASEVVFDSFEALREVVPGARREIVQIEPGRLAGKMLHTTLGDLPIDAASFSRGVRSSGEYRKDRITLSLLLSSGGRALHSNYRSAPGDVVLTPPASEQENRYVGATSLLVTSVTLREIEAIYHDEPALASLDYSRRAQFDGADGIVPRVALLLDRLRKNDLALTEPAEEFWKQALIDVLMGQVLNAAPAVTEGHLPSALKLVRAVDEFLEAEQNRAVHIAEICSAFRVPRRTLHRAFHDVVGAGPIAYLRFKRLCAIHSVLRSGGLGDRTIEDIAFQYGFLNAGRFSHYYKKQFGKLPVDTRAHPMRRRDRETA
jgi:AraC-like DNA-binding protein